VSLAMEVPAVLKSLLELKCAQSSALATVCVKWANAFVIPGGEIAIAAKAFLLSARITAGEMGSALWGNAFAILATRVLIVAALSSALPTVASMECALMESVFALRVTAALSVPPKLSPPSQVRRTTQREKLAPMHAQCMVFALRVCACVSRGGLVLLVLGWMVG
jgi:hypothetical protein